MENIFI